jgi:hypothetical protein
MEIGCANIITEIFLHYSKGFVLYSGASELSGFFADDGSLSSSRSARYFSASNAAMHPEPLRLLVYARHILRWKHTCTGDSLSVFLVLNVTSCKDTRYIS